MSKENVALFLGAIADKKDLNDQIAAAPKTPDAWISLANKSGFEFSADELHNVVQEVLDLNDLKKETSIEALVAALDAQGGELSDAQMESVAGGASTSTFNINTTFLRRLNTLGYPGGGMNQASYIEMPPAHIQTSGMTQFNKYRF